MKDNVFLSFRGRDTRNGFISHLCKALHQKNIEAFRDNDKIQKGEEISPALLTAIEESKLAVIVFSKNYASSKWCLDEVVKIMDWKKRNEHYFVVPVFYDIDPSELREQTGSFAKAFAKHEEDFKHNILRVETWKTALTKAANLAGWNSRVTWPESILIDKIVKDISKKLNHGTSSCFEGLAGIERPSRLWNPEDTYDALTENSNNRGYRLLPELRQSEPSQKIKVRVARMWDSVIHGVENKVVSIDLLLVDEKGNAMQACIQKKHQHMFKSVLKETSVYEISDFYVGKTNSSFNAVCGEQMINFNRSTKVNEITNPTVPYPLNYFDFQAFPPLPSRVDNNSLLTDVIGVLIAIGQVHEGYTKDKAVDERQDIKLQDLQGNKLNATLWAAHARTLDREKLVEKANVVLILAGMTVCEYQGMTNLRTSSATKMYIDLPITETGLLKLRYEGRPLLVQPFDDPVKPRRTETSGPNKNRMTVDQLMKLDLEKSKGIIFTCTAEIADIDSTDGWYYNGCNQCSKGLKLINGKFCCPNSGHGEQRPKLMCKLSMVVRDNTGEADFVAFGEIGENLIGKTITQIAAMEKLDRFTLPTAVKSLKGQERVFQIRLTKQAVNSGRPTFAINKVYFVEQEQATSTVVATSLLTSLVDTIQQSAESIVPVHGAEAISKTVTNIPADLFPEESPIKQKAIRIQDRLSDVNDVASDSAQILVRKGIFSSNAEDTSLSNADASPEINPETDDPVLKKLKSK